MFLKCCPKVNKFGKSCCRSRVVESGRSKESREAERQKLRAGTTRTTQNQPNEYAGTYKYRHLYKPQTSVDCRRSLEESRASTRCGKMWEIKASL